jgi:hypothetical protein
MSERIETGHWKRVNDVALGHVLQSSYKQNVVKVRRITLCETCAYGEMRPINVIHCRSAQARGEAQTPAYPHRGCSSFDLLGVVVP